jgi:biopolymer transport protein ExbD
MFAGEEEAINMTPMLDIVFIMLIFFIVTTSFVRESGISVNRPSAATAEKKDQGSNIVVAIRPNEEIWIDRKQTDFRAVRANIERLRSQNPDGNVIIEADTDSRTGILVKVMDQIRLAGIENISIAANTPSAK